MECTQLVDLIFFMGQSNMAGRGDAALAPAVTPGMGYEYRAVTDPAQLHPLAEPFGVNENDPTGVNEPGMKTGSMVSAFVNACTAKTGVAIMAYPAPRAVLPLPSGCPACRFLRMPSAAPARRANS